MDSSFGRQRLRRSKNALFIGSALVLLPGLGIGASPSESGDDEVPNRPVIHIGSADWTPYFFGGRQGAPKGSAVEILEICLPELGYEPEFIPATVDEVFEGLRSNRFQLHVLSFRPERETYLQYGDEPMFYSGYRPFVRSGLELQGPIAEALADLRLAHRRGMTYSTEFDAFMRRRIESGDVLVVESDEEGLRAVAEGKVDAVPLMLSTALRHRRRLSLEAAVDVALDMDLKTAAYRVAITKQQRVIDDPNAFLDGIDACLRRLKVDGRYDAIGERYADLID